MIAYIYNQTNAPIFGCVYLILNKLTQKIYVGQTTETVTKRWNRHVSKALNNKAGCSKLYNSIRKHGPGAFTHQILAVATDRLGLDALETLYIQKFDSVNTGYNISSVARVAVISEAGKRALREAVVGKAHCISNVENTPDVKARRTASLKITWAEKGYKPIPPQGPKNRRNMYGINRTFIYYENFLYQSFSVFCEVNGIVRDNLKAVLLRAGVRLSGKVLVDLNKSPVDVKSYLNKRVT